MTDYHTPEPWEAELDPAISSSYEIDGRPVNIELELLEAALADICGPHEESNG